MCHHQRLTGFTVSCLFRLPPAVRYTVDADHNRRGARVRFLDNKLSTFTGLLSFSAPTCKELELSVFVRDHPPGPPQNHTQTNKHIFSSSVNALRFILVFRTNMKFAYGTLYRIVHAAYYKNSMSRMEACHCHH